jgi:fatty-acyl-CoA synthase
MKWETPMNGRSIAVTPSAHAYPLLIKQLLHTPLAQTAHQEIVYRDVRRQLRNRIGRLASALQKIGVRPGDSVGVLDWDSNRFLEAFFAIPMMGVVLQTVNVRLSSMTSSSTSCSRSYRNCRRSKGWSSSPTARRP